MKTLSLLALIGQATQATAVEEIAGKTTEGHRINRHATKVFNWRPSDASCGTDNQEENSWNVHYGSRENPNHLSTGEAGGFKPIYHSEGKNGYCTFDGLNDYLAVDKLFEEPTSAFTVKAMFRTTSKDNNWSFLDCDRSEYFNLSLNPNGKIVFATSGSDGTINHQKDDMISIQKNLNDGEWHTVTAVFHDGVKSIFIDGWLDASSMQNQASTLYNHVGTINPTNGESTVRSCFIADGSEATELDGKRNNFHYEGDISSVEFYYGKVVIPDNPSFAYYPQVHTLPDGSKVGSCVSETAYGWPVSLGNAEGNAPKFGGDGNLNYCEFNGQSDYLAIDKRYFNDAVNDFQIRAVFSTTYDGGDEDDSNWALFDCDRSEFFHLSVNKNGKVVFSTAGKNTAGEDVPEHDMYSRRSGLNDGNWHEVIVKYHNDGEGKGAMKRIIIDGTEDGRNGRFNRQYDCVGDKCRDAIGSDKKKRFCYIGDGSESSVFNGPRNNKYFEGKIAVIDYVENGDDLPGTSPLDCMAKHCHEWDCKLWCACYEEQWDQLYADNGCAEDGSQDCECGWGRDGGYLIAEHEN